MASLALPAVAGAATGQFSVIGSLQSDPADVPLVTADDRSILVANGIFERPDGGWVPNTPAAVAFSTQPIGVTADADAFAEACWPWSCSLANEVDLSIRPPAVSGSLATWATQAPPWCGCHLPDGSRQIALTLPSGWRKFNPGSDVTPQSPWPGDVGDVAVLGHAVVLIARSTASASSRLAIFERPAAGWWDAGHEASVFLDPPDAGVGGASGFDWIAAGGSTIVARTYVQRSGEPRSTTFEVFVRPTGGWVAGAAPAATLSVPTLPSGATFADVGFVTVADHAVVIGMRDPAAHLVGTFDYKGFGPVSTVLVYERGAAGWASTSTATALLTVTAPTSQTMGPSAAITPDGGALLVSGSRIVSGSGVPERKRDILFEFDRSPHGWKDGTEAQAIDSLDAGTFDHNDVNSAPMGLWVAAGRAVAAVSGPYPGTILLGRTGHPATAARPPTPQTLVPGLAIATSDDGSTLVIRHNVIADTGNTFGFQVFERGSGWSHPSAPGLIVPPDPCGQTPGCYASTRQVVLSADGSAAAVLPADDTNAPTPIGPIEVFERPPGGWAGKTVTTPAQTLQGESVDVFPMLVAFAGRSVAATGLPTGSATRAVYVFERPKAGWPGGTIGPTARLDLPHAGDAHVLVADGDQVGLLNDVLATGGGAGTNGYLWKRPAAGWRSTGSAEHFEVPVARAQGYALGQQGPDNYHFAQLRGGILVVGAVPLRPDGGRTANRASAALVFAPVHGSWSAVRAPVAVLTASADAIPNTLFAATVATDGATIVVGAAPVDPLGYGAPGIAFVYRRPPGGWSSMQESSTLWTSDLLGAFGGCEGGQCGWATITGGQVLLVSPCSGPVAQSAVCGNTYVMAVPPALRGSVTVRPSPVTVRAARPTFAATCSVKGWKTSRCVVTLRSADGVVVATGHAATTRPVAALKVPLLLSASARRLLKAASGRLPTSAEAVVTVASGGGTAPARSTATLIAPTVKLTLASDVLFAFDSADLTGAARAVLARLGHQLAGSKALRCDGYTDSVGTAAYNLDLGRRRAVAVCTALKAFVKATSSRTFGETHPVAPNTTPVGRALNRRVEITVSN